MNDLFQSKNAKGKKPWMKEELLRMIEERKKIKDRDRDKYQELNMRRGWNRTKEMRLKVQFKEIEDPGMMNNKKKSLARNRF